MSRTTIDIDDDLIAWAMHTHQLPTKKAAVDYALRRLVVEPMSREEALSLRGSGWEGDLDELRGAHEPPFEL